ncbi:GGDEF domain-containing protein [Brevibacillus massiliensis]|jgi:diguanylate cyclase (GGDEF)-like protein|uniref:GGDEF domain-containing protein n=1 Tax=Brevibacillus massiliensis TaxID=1118054 RepID=UPI00031E127C|nr:diguanylate cyclase [Brevibacillus massiliensis]
MTEDLFLIQEIKKRQLEANRDPLSLPVVHSLEKGEFEKRLKDYRSYLKMIRSCLKRILDTVPGVPIVFTVTDKEGYFLELLGDESILAMVRKMGLGTGKKILDELSSINLALQLGRQYKLIGTEHFLKILSDTACYSVPFYDREHGNLLGTISMMTTLAHTTPFHLTTLEIISDSVEREILLQRQNRILQRLTLTDDLTGIYNRRFMDVYLSEEIRRNRPVSLILIDVDFFKEYNDHLGHLAGDNCLKRVAQKISQLLYRTGDFAARYGGEEFCVVLPDTEMKGALHVAKRIQAGIEELSIPHPGLAASRHVTVSMGIATFDSNRRCTPKELLVSADKALYQAKREGRNRIACWQD